MYRKKNYRITLQTSVCMLYVCVPLQVYCVPLLFLFLLFCVPLSLFFERYSPRN